MKISIVIPAHNEEKSITETIEAILAQQHPDFEVIVVDNASTDRTSEVASAYPIKVVVEPRKGLLFARERGRLEATGEIIANIDADCLPQPDWLTQAESLFTDDNIVAVTGPYDYHDGGKIFRNTSLATQTYIYHPVSKILQHRFVKGGAILIGGNNFIRAEALHKVGGYNTALTFYGEDTDTAKRVSQHGYVLFSPKIVIKTSARRFKAEGTLTLLFKYWYYFIKHTFFTKKTPR